MSTLSSISHKFWANSFPRNQGPLANGGGPTHSRQCLVYAILFNARRIDERMFRGVNTDEAGSTKYLCIATFVTIALGTLHLTSLHGMTVHAVQTAIAWRVPLGPVLLKNVAEISNLDGNLQLLSYSTSILPS